MYWNSFFNFWRLCLGSPILLVWCVEDVMIHYNNDNNAYCLAVNDQIFETKEHNTVKITTFLHTRNLCSYSHLEIFICIYSVRGEIDQISINTLRYTMCCAPNVYMFVYTLIEAHIVPLNLCPRYHVRSLFIIYTVI